MHLHYQPQLDSKRRIIGAESLLRWEHPERGMIGPDIFIPLAEETGLILSIGRWAMQTACAQIKAWPGAIYVWRSTSARASSDSPALSPK